MEEMKKKVQDICELRDKLTTAAKEQCNKGLESVNTHEMGEVVDMIKDLCESEEKLAKACYYKKVVEAMEEEKEEEEMMARMGGGRMGYDNWRYDSGRFAPTGRGHRSGYRPSDDQIETWMHEDAFGEDPWAKEGYRGSGSRSGSGGRSGSNYNSGNGSMGNNGRMGYPRSERGDRYERWHQARMGYHESKDAAHKEHMDASAREYVVDVAESMKEIWRDADPAMRKELKNKLVALTGEMN